MTARRQNLNLQKSLQGLEKTLAAAIKEAIEKASFSIDEKALIAAIDNLDFAAILNLTRINPAVMFPIDEAIRGGFIQGGGLVAGDLAAGLAGTYSFNGRHPEAEAWIRENGGRLIDGITDESLQSVRTIIEEGISSGRSSSSLAREITGRKVGSRRVGGILGLNSEQTKHLSSARAILSDPSRIREYFIKDSETGRWKPRYKLSDRRFDRQIREAIRDGRALSGKTLDDVMTAHRSKALGYRGRVIAKDQSFRALAAGRAMGYDQLLQDPNVEKVTVRWQHNLSTNPREDHVAMDGTIVDLGETFQFDDAAMKHPHDPAGGAKHSIGCRCVAIYRVVMKRDNPATAPNPAPQPRTPAPAPRLPPIPPMPRRAAPQPRTPVDIPEPQPETVSGFQLRPFTPARTKEEAEQMAVDLGISHNRPTFMSNAPIDHLNTWLKVSAEIDDRFEMTQLTLIASARWMSSSTNLNVKVMAKAAAWYSPKYNAIGMNTDATNPAQLAKKYKFNETNKVRQLDARNERLRKLDVNDPARVAAERLGDAWDYTATPMNPRNVAIHEQGHRFHYQTANFEEINRAIGFGRGDEWRKWIDALSGYGATNNREFVAESFAIYLGAPDQHWRIMPALLNIFKDRDKANVT